MSIQEFTASGTDALALATALLQRARQADPEAGLWEAADVQWWWRKERLSDDVATTFWVDDRGPVAGVLVTSWTDDVWQFDPVHVPHVSGPDHECLWSRTLEITSDCAPKEYDVPVRDDDPVFSALAMRAEFAASGSDYTAWMDAADQPAVSRLPEGFQIVDRSQRPGNPHPLRRRNGVQVAERLAQCSLYDPELDLAVATADGTVAGYSLYWFDPTTSVGLVEPVRVEDEFQRRGLARAMLTTGIDRLARKGATRFKISYETDAAASLYEGIGFRRTSSATWYRASGVSDE